MKSRQFGGAVLNRNLKWAIKVSFTVKGRNFAKKSLINLEASEYFKLFSNLCDKIWFFIGTLTDGDFISIAVFSQHELKYLIRLWENSENTFLIRRGRKLLKNYLLMIKKKRFAFIKISRIILSFAIISLFTSKKYKNLFKI